jgi:hypothetical protein
MTTRQENRQHKAVPKISHSALTMWAGTAPSRRSIASSSSSDVVSASVAPIVSLQATHQHARCKPGFD